MEIDKFLMGFLIAIIGVSFIGAIASNVLTTTSFTGVENEANAFTPWGATEADINETEVHTVTNYPTGWKLNDCPLTSFVIMNGSDGTALTETTDYTVNLTAGTFLLVNTSTTIAMVGADNNTYIDYQYCDDGYLNSSWGRNVLKLGPGLFAVMILVAILGLLLIVVRKTQD